MSYMLLVHLSDMGSLCDTECISLRSFEGQVKPDRGQAAYIVFCAVLGLASAGLVLSIAVPAIGAPVSA